MAETIADHWKIVAGMIENLDEASDSDVNEWRRLFYAGAKAALRLLSEGATHAALQAELRKFKVGLDEGRN